MNIHGKINNIKTNAFPGICWERLTGTAKLPECLVGPLCGGLAPPLCGGLGSLCGGVGSLCGGLGPLCGGLGSLRGGLTPCGGLGHLCGGLGPLCGGVGSLIFRAQIKRAFLEV